MAFHRAEPDLRWRGEAAVGVVCNGLRPRAPEPRSPVPLLLGEGAGGWGPPVASAPAPTAPRLRPALDSSRCTGTERSAIVGDFHLPRDKGPPPRLRSRGSGWRSAGGGRVRRRAA